MRRWRGSAAVAVVLMVTLVGAPLARTVQPTCAACPPGCPMHAQKRLGCHEQGGGHHDCGSRGPGLTPPGCGGARALPGVALPPAVLPTALAAWSTPLVTGYRPALPSSPARGTEPPDTPPPIVVR